VKAQATSAGTSDAAVGSDPLDQARLAQLAEEQAALRRVATLVARDEPPEVVFAAVAEEVGRLLKVDFAILVRYDSPDSLEVVGTWTGTGGPAPTPVGSQLPLGGRNVSTEVHRTGRSARIDFTDVSGVIGQVASHDWELRSSVGVPVSAGSRLWGCMLVGFSHHELLPADTEVRLASFTELVTTAIANADSRTALARLAEEQVALRRVATMVARGAPPDQVFAAVTQEFAQLVPVDVAAMARLEPDGTLIYVASWGRAVDFMPVGSRWTLDGTNVATAVFETGRPTRVESQTGASGSLSDVLREMGVHSVVATPVVVEGRVWGGLGAGSTLEQPLPPDAEARLASFTELVATAIANADSHAELMASRARIVAAGDESRRQIERDLHDGTQQQLVSLMLELKKAETAPPSEESGLHAQLVRTRRTLAEVLDGLQELSRGIHPAILSKGGLVPALKALSRRSAVPVSLDVRVERRLPEHLEVAAYYVASEALANTTKHASATAVTIELDEQDATLRLQIGDDGIGGADPVKGSGLTGLRDRVEAIGGTLEVTSPANGGTTLLIQIPL
jgi:signal transduction histidine kinase